MVLDLTAALILIEVVFACSSASLDCPKYLSQTTFHSAYHTLPPSSPTSNSRIVKFPYSAIVGEELMGLGGG